MVYLVGAGPGDPGLLTLRGRACLAEADVIIYDYLVNPELLGHARPDAERIEVGKHGVGRTRSQAEIEALMMTHGRAGKVVVRLKGGDPFVFGRGGEEALALDAAGLPWEVVPGITAGVAAPAYAGIPLTHRDYAATVVFATGHEQWNKGYTAVEWAALAHEQATAVFYMGVRRLRENLAQLASAGRSPSTPAALIEWGTLPRQRVIRGTIETLPALADKANVVPPALLVVGQVAGLGEALRWFERRPLAGKRVVVCRQADQASAAATLLGRFGAEMVALPTVHIEDVGAAGAVAGAEGAKPMTLATALTQPYDIIAFTSQNGVNAFFRGVWAMGRDARVLGNAEIAVVGRETAHSLEVFGVRPDIMPPVGQAADAEALVAAFAARAQTDPISGKQVLWVRGNRGRNVLAEGLIALGAEVHEVVVYRTATLGDPGVPLSAEFQAAVDNVRSAPPNAVLFASPSQVQGFFALFGAEAAALLSKAKVAAIGEVTSQALADRGIAVDVVPERGETSMAGLISALARSYVGGAEAQVAGDKG